MVSIVLVWNMDRNRSLAINEDNLKLFSLSKFFLQTNSFQYSFVIHFFLTIYPKTILNIGKNDLLEANFRKNL